MAANSRLKLYFPTLLFIYRHGTIEDIINFFSWFIVLLCLPIPQNETNKLLPTQLFLGPSQRPEAASRKQSNLNLLYPTDSAHSWEVEKENKKRMIRSSVRWHRTSDHDIATLPGWPMWVRSWICRGYQQDIAEVESLLCFLVSFPLVRVMIREISHMELPCTRIAFFHSYYKIVWIICHRIWFVVIS